jgi:hypothetical protein
VRVLVAAILSLLAAGAAGAQPNSGTNGEIAFERGGVVQAFDPRNGTTREVTRGVQPAWSPGGEIAFVRDGTIYLAGADGSNERALTTGSWPAWSPDGTQLAFVRGRLLRLDVATGTETAVTGPGDIVSPAWSPDGTRIAYAANGAIFTVGLDGGSSTDVVTGGRAAGGPAWSPDGTQLAYVGVNGQLYVVSGTSTKQLTYTLAGATAAIERPAWSPDGTLVAWAQGPDICVADPAGKVARLTRTPDGAPAAASPDWQATAWPTYRPVAAPPGAHDAASCDRIAGARVDILEGNVAPQVVTVAAPAELVFVNHLSATVRVALQGKSATVVAGGTLGFPTSPGEFPFVVTGYPDGVPRRGHYVGTSAARVTIEQHAAITYGTSTMLTGAAAGVPGDPVLISAKPIGASRATRIARLVPSSGRWRLAVSPRITTLYTVAYGGVATERRLRVTPALRVSHAGSSVAAVFTPGRALRGKAAYLFRAAGRGWTQAAAARIGATGTAAFSGVVPGRYYVGFPGNSAYWAAASEPFTIGR